MEEYHTGTKRSDVLTVNDGYRGSGPADTTGRADTVARTWPAAVGSEQGARAHTPPSFAAPALVLVAALAIILGYTCLHLMPDGRFWPTSLPFALVLAPATCALTWRPDEWRWGPVRSVIRVDSVLVLVLGLFAAGDRTALLNRVLGATSLFLAVSLMVLVVASEHHTGSSPRID